MNADPRRPLALAPLRTFLAVAQALSFSAAADALGLSQPAVSRQVQALEAELGTVLFVRGTRRVELTQAGRALQQAALPLVEQLDRCVRELRRRGERRQVTVSSFASLFSLWLLPRLADFQRDHPDIDIRLSAEDRYIDMDDPDCDFVLRFGAADAVPAHAERLFGEVLTPVASPWLVKSSRAGTTPALVQPADLARHTWLEEDSAASRRQQLGWRRWLQAQGLGELQPRRWLYLDYTHQQVQAALAGQGVALARLALVHDAIERGDLVEPFGRRRRVALPPAYWLVPLPGARLRPELRAAMDWVRAQAALTRAATGDDGTPPAMSATHRSDARAGLPRRRRAA